VLIQGIAHLLAIKSTGGVILGERSLDLDGTFPWEFHTSHGHGAWVTRGWKEIRPALPKELGSRPVLATWGFGVLHNLAKDLSQGRPVRDWPLPD